MISALAAKMTPAARGADVAQLVEQLIRNEQVTGSIPAIGSIKIARPLGLVIFMDLMVGTSQRFAPSKARSPSLPSAPFFLRKNSAGASQGANGSIFLAKKFHRSVPRGKRLHFCTKYIYFLGLRFFLGCSAVGLLGLLRR